MFGNEYSQAAGAFQLLLLSIGFIFIHGAIHNTLLVYDLTKVEMWNIAAAAGLNVGLNMLLIPRYGLIGAALTTVLAEGLVLLLGLVTVYRYGINFTLRPLLRPLVAAGVMGGGLIALGPGQNLILYLSGGFVMYVCILAVFRGIPQDARPYLKDLSLFGIKLLHVLFQKGFHRD